MDRAQCVRLILEKIDRETVGVGCHEWKGALSRKGYGVVYFEGKMVYVHRFVWALNKGPIPDGMKLDHIVCRNRPCCNFLHLRCVTPRVNSLENNLSPIILRAQATSCVHGHPFTPENTYVRKNGTRQCRQCRNAATLAIYYQKREAQRGTC